jgi:hypothetical protein
MWNEAQHDTIPALDRWGDTGARPVRLIAAEWSGGRDAGPDGQSVADAG